MTYLDKYLEHMEKVAVNGSRMNMECAVCSKIGHSARSICPINGHLVLKHLLAHPANLNYGKDVWVCMNHLKNIGR